MNDTTLTPVTDSQSTASPVPTLLIVFISLQQVIFVLACSGNLFVIYIIIRYLKLRDNTNIYILNLALADFLTGVSSGMQVFYVVYRSINTEQVWCILRFQLVGAMTLSSQVTVLLLSVDRLIAICYAKFYDKIAKTKLFVFSAFLPWTFSLSITMPTLVNWNRWRTGAQCSYSLIFTTEYFWTIALLMCFMSLLSCAAHARIYHAIRMFYRRVSPENEMSNEDMRLQKKIKGAKVWLFITIMFCFCWLPYVVFPFAYANGLEKNFNLRQSSSWLVFLGMLNSVMNPLLYAWYKQDFRKACRKVCVCQ